MKTEQQQVAEWMQAFGQEVPDKVTMPSLEVRKLRARLILEEARETVTALGVYWDTDAGRWNETNGTDHSLEMIADGIADSLVVLLGTAVACGIDIKPVFDEVMCSNRSKMWTSEELEALKEDYFINKKVLNYTYKEYDKSIVGERRFILMLDGKVIKSPSYSPANIVLK